jgi:hypothetical protein
MVAAEPLRKTILFGNEGSLVIFEEVHAATE